MIIINYWYHRAVARERSCGWFPGCRFGLYHSHFSHHYGHLLLNFGYAQSLYVCMSVLVYLILYDLRFIITLITFPPWSLRWQYSAYTVYRGRVREWDCDYLTYLFTTDPRELKLKSKRVEEYQAGKRVFELFPNQLNQLLQFLNSPYSHSHSHLAFPSPIIFISHIFSPSYLSLLLLSLSFQSSLSSYHIISYRIVLRHRHRHRPCWKLTSLLVPQSRSEPFIVHSTYTPNVENRPSLVSLVSLGVWT